MVLSIDGVLYFIGTPKLPTLIGVAVSVALVLSSQIDSLHLEVDPIQLGVPSPCEVQCEETTYANLHANR